MYSIYLKDSPFPQEEIMSHFLKTLGGLSLSWRGSTLVPPGGIQVFRTRASAGAAASVSHPVSHNEEEHSFDVFIHTAFVYMLSVFWLCTLHVKRHCCDSLHQTQPRSEGETAKPYIYIKNEIRKEVIILSVFYQGKQHNGILPAFATNCPPSAWERCGSWISGGLMV